MARMWDELDDGAPFLFQNHENDMCDSGTTAAKDDSMRMIKYDV